LVSLAQTSCRFLAIAYCEAAIEGRDTVFALFHSWFPDFELVRTDPRFPDILTRFNLAGKTDGDPRI